MSHDRAKQLLSKSESFLSECRQAAESGKDVDMAGFEKTVQEFCLLLEKMPREEALQYEKDLKKIGSDLNNLSEALAKKRDELKGQIHGLDQHKKAQAAYKRADVEKPKKEE